MEPVSFPQANKVFTAPPDLDESQCRSIPAFLGSVGTGNLDGADVVIVAWMPSPQDIHNLLNGAPVFLLCLGGLPPHQLTTEFPK